MPKIATFDAPDNLGLRPSETGINATAAAARRLQADYSERAAATESLGHSVSSTVQIAGTAATKYIEHEEISKNAATFANLINVKTKQWDDIAKNADPNDPTIGPKFINESLEPDLAKFRDNFLTEAGQKWAESRVDQFRQHMFTKTSADMATLAGQAAVLNHHQMVNSLSNSVRSDPASMDFTLKTLNDSVNAVVASNPNLTGALAGKLRSEMLQKGSENIIMAAALGAIEKTGKVPEWTSDPKYSPYINATELKKLAQAARYYQRLDAGEERSQRLEADRLARDDFNKQVNKLEIDTMPENVGDAPRLPADYWKRLRDLGTHPGAALEPGRLKTMVTQGEAITNRMNKPEPLGRISHDTTMSLLQRMRATDNTRLTDNTPIYDAYQKGELNNADFNFLNREFANLRTPDGAALEKTRSQFAKTFARLIDGSMNDAGIHSLLGTQRMYEFEMDARRQEEALRKAGKDPHLVYDPRSEYFFGRPENIAKYRVTMQEAAAYERTLKEMDKQPKPAPQKEIPTGPSQTEVIDIPPNMTPAEAIKRYKAGQTVRLPDGRLRVVPELPK